MYENYLMLQGLVSLVAIIAIVALVMHFFEIRKTKKYRRELGDLYVAGKIKQIASKESIDLAKEKLDFLDWEKRNKLKENMNLDDVVEEELKEKVSEGVLTKFINRNKPEPTKKSTKKKR